MRWAIYHQGATPLTYHYCTDAVHALKRVKLFSFNRHGNCMLSTKDTTHIHAAYSPQITEGARMVLRYLTLCSTVAPVRPGVYYHSASHPWERWHRGCLEKTRTKWFNCISAPVSERWHPSERWHRGCLEKTRTKLLIVFPHRYRRDGTHRRDRTGGAKKREGKIISKRDRTRCYPSLDCGTCAWYVPPKSWSQKIVRSPRCTTIDNSIGPVCM